MITKLSKTCINFFLILFFCSTLYGQVSLTGYFLNIIFEHFDTAFIGTSYGNQHPLDSILMTATYNQIGQIDTLVRHGQYEQKRMVFTYDKLNNLEDIHSDFLDLGYQWQSERVIFLKRDNFGRVVHYSGWDNTNVYSTVLGFYLYNDLNQVVWKFETKRDSSSKHSFEKWHYIYNGQNLLTAYRGWQSSDSATWNPLEVYDSIIYYDENIKDVQFSINNSSPPIGAINYFSEKKKFDLSFSIFPNPARNEVYISDAASDFILTMYNLSGQEVRQCHLDKNQISSNIPIDLSNLDSGMYILEFKTKEQVFRTKLVKI
jgi:hypothetical protein